MFVIKDINFSWFIYFVIIKCIKISIDGLNVYRYMRNCLCVVYYYYSVILMS